MYNFLKLPFFVFCLCIVVSAAATDKYKTANALLWKISGNGMSKPSYIFGTIHLICPEDFFLTNAMKNAVEQVDKVCFEMDLDDNSVMMSSMGGLMDNSGKKMKDYFTEAQYAKLKKFMKDSMGMEMAFLQQMKPVALESILGMKATGCSSPISYEDSIMRMALRMKKEIVGLEKPEEQIEVLTSMPDDSVVISLMQMIDEFGKTKAEYANMVSAYKKQDIDKLYAIIADSKDMQGSMDAFLDSRNKRWIPKIKEMVKQNSLYIAVGAGHLGGKNGVLALLKAEGYTVEPMK